SMSGIRGLAACALGSLGLLYAPGASANLTLDFGGITENDENNTGTGETQLQVDILDGGGGFRAVDYTISFLVKNLGPAQSTITDIFFMDQQGLLESIIGIDNSDPGVDYFHPSSLPNLPGGENFGFFATPGFSAQPSDPRLDNGVDPGESVTIIFSFAHYYYYDEEFPEENGTTFEDIIAAINDGSLQIGLRVEGFENGGAESFLSIRPIPLPAPVFAGMAGLGLLGVRRTRRSV
ncbi:MAG: hypothetical protein ACF8GE_02280, partial [Phycisphaerales bacterium JB043]